MVAIGPIIATLLFFLAGNATAGWVTQSSGTTRTLHSVTGAHGNFNQAWACGEGGVILYTSNGGATWVAQNSGTASTLYAIVFIETSGGPLVAVGENGTIIRTTNSGTTWTPVQSGTTANLYGLSDFQIHAVGDSGIMLRTPDFGLTWLKVPSVTSKPLRAVSTSSGGIACGDSGVVLKKFSGVNVWNVSSAGTTADLFGIPMFASNDIIVGDSGLVLRSSNSGTSWFRQPTPTPHRLRRAQFSTNNNSRIYCVGDGGTILKSTNNGTTWGTQPSGTNRNLRSVFFYLSDNFGWAVGDSGTILRTIDGGGQITGVIEGAPEPPVSASLGKNFPNPFNPGTTIPFFLTHPEFVSLTVFNILGEEIATLISDRMSAGNHEIYWDAQGASTGMYLYRLEAGWFVETRKFLLLR